MALRLPDRLQLDKLMPDPILRNWRLIANSVLIG